MEKPMNQSEITDRCRKTVGCLIRRLTLAVLTAGFSLSSEAVEVSDAYLDSVFNMNEVVVTENRRREIVPSQTLEGDRLERLNSQSVADALRYFSGVQIKDFGGVGGIKTVNMRSMGSQNVGVFYDGLQLGNAQNGQVDLGRYSLDNIEEISVYNGQKSNIFQSAKDFGPAGVIYIRTRRPRWNGDSDKSRFTARMRFGSFGLANPDVVMERRLSHSVSLSASAGYTYANGRYKFTYRRKSAEGGMAYDTTATRHNGDISAFRSEVSLFGFSERGNWSGKVYYYDSERGIPGAIVNNVLRNGERQWDRSFFVQGGGEWLMTPRYHLKVNAKWAWDYTRFLRNDPLMLQVDNNYYQQEFYLSAAQMFKINSWWRVTLSTDFQWNKLNADLVDFLYPVRYTEMVAAATSVSVGPFDAQAALLGTFIQDRAGGTLRQARESIGRNRFTPSVFLSWQPLSGIGWTVNGFFKRAFRMPTFNDLYYTDVGNKYLKPEMTTQYDVGMAYSVNFSRCAVKSISVQLDGYYNRVADKIVAYPSGQQFRWTMLNLGKVDILGIDLSAGMRASIGNVSGDLRVNYTYQHAIDITDPLDTYYKDQIPYVPRHAATMAATVDWHGWNLNASVLYTGERYNAQENKPSNYEPAWTTTDVSLFKEFKTMRVKWCVGLEVNNLFDQNYEVINCYPMPGRNYRINLKITI